MSADELVSTVEFLEAEVTIPRKELATEAKP